MDFSELLTTQAANFSAVAQGKELNARPKSAEATNTTFRLLIFQNFFGSVEDIVLLEKQHGCVVSPYTKRLFDTCTTTSTRLLERHGLVFFGDFLGFLCEL